MSLKVSLPLVPKVGLSERTCLGGNSVARQGTGAMRSLRWMMPCLKVALRLAILYATGLAAATPPGDIVKPADRGAATMNSWFHHRDDGETYPAFYSSQLDRATYACVKPTRIHETVRLLRYKAFIPITAGQAAKFASHPIKARQGLQFFLLRGLYLDDDLYDRGFYELEGVAVYQLGRRLFVVQDCFGNKRLPMKRRPVVALLAQPPLEVDVTCTMDY